MSSDKMNLLQKQQNAGVRRISVKDATTGCVRELVFPASLDIDRPKRDRTSFTAHQLFLLEEEFLKAQYLVGRDRTELARRLNLSETQIKVWFQNRRTKHKRDQDSKRGGDSSMNDCTTVQSATTGIRRLIERSNPLYSITRNLIDNGGVDTHAHFNQSTCQTGKLMSNIGHADGGSTHTPQSNSTLENIFWYPTANQMMTHQINRAVHDNAAVYNAMYYT